MQNDQKKRTCKMCGESYTPTSGRQVYCEACGKEHRKAKLRQYSEAYAQRWYGGKKA